MSMTRVRLTEMITAFTIKKENHRPKVKVKLLIDKNNKAYESSGSKVDKKTIDCGEDYGLKFNKKHFSSSVLKKLKDCETQSKSKSGE